MKTAHAAHSLKPISKYTRRELRSMPLFLVQVSFEGGHWGGISEPAMDLIKSLLDRDYNTRVTAAEALQHPWITDQCGDDGCIVPSNVLKHERLRQLIRSPNLQS